MSNSHPGSKISLIAKLTAAEGKSAELEEALRGVIAAADEEHGLEVYSAHAALDTPGVYYFFELYRDAEAKAAHGKGERMRAAMGAFAGLLGGRPELIPMTPLAAKGLDL
ncbi:MAG TPA: putative quinol monooxygenase [Ilumatobacter sp.]